MHSAVKIAKHFVDLANNNDVKDMTLLKLMKITYIAHGWMLGVYGKELVSDDIEAWKYGPVIPDLYRETKEFGRNPVINLPSKFQVVLNREETSIVSQVFANYREFTAGQLVSLTHKVGTPWHEISEKHGAKPGVVIPNALIESYYRRLVEGV